MCLKGNDLKDLQFALTKAKLPTTLDRIIDQCFVFQSWHGSHNNLLAGKVHSLQLSDEGGLQLYVSCTQFGSSPLVSLVYMGDEWNAQILYTDKRGNIFEFFKEF